MGTEINWPALMEQIEANKMRGDIAEACRQVEVTDVVYRTAKYGIAEGRKLTTAEEQVVSVLYEIVEGREQRRKELANKARA